MEDDDDNKSSGTLKKKQSLNQQPTRRAAYFTGENAKTLMGYLSVIVCLPYRFGMQLQDQEHIDGKRKGGKRHGALQKMRERNQGGF